MKTQKEIYDQEELRKYRNMQSWRITNKQSKCIYYNPENGTDIMRLVPCSLTKESCVLYKGYDEKLKTIPFLIGQTYQECPNFVYRRNP